MRLIAIEDFSNNYSEVQLISLAFAMMDVSRILFALGILGVLAAQAEVATSGLELESKANKITEDAELNIRQLIRKYGYQSETHEVTTDDGYILEMHRITGPKKNPSATGKPPILLVHPLLSSSYDWIITGPGKAFGYILADKGYDVWLGNIRGNTFARKHHKYTSVDKEFWQFSWHESGMYDLPTMIDHILATTDNTQLTYVGHSLGSTAFWVMASERPEYQSKIKSMFALAPVAYMTYTKSPFFQVLAKFEHSAERLAALLGYYEFEPTNKIVESIAAKICKDEAWTQFACSNIMSLIGGSSYNQLNATMLPSILAHSPAGGSVKQLLHFLQVIKARKFQMWDYGFMRNLLKYKHIRPPTYKLSNIKVPVYLYFSKGDRFAAPMDVDRLDKELGNSIGKFKVTDDNFAHMDFLWGKDAKKLIYDKIIAQIGNI